MFKHHTKTDKGILITNGIVLTLIVLLVVTPLLYVLMASFTDPATLLNSGLTLDPSKWTLQGYERIFQDGSILTGFRNSLFYSTAFSILSVAVTLGVAYPLSRPDFAGRKIIMTLFIITMFFGGGLIPTYLLVKNLNMLDTVWAILLPGAVNVWNIILARAYFKGVPSELREAAAMDGTSEIQYFFRILLPLSKPIIAVLLLYQFVGQWNSYFDAMIYLKSEDLQPLQIVLRSILVQMEPRPGMIQDAQNTAELQQIAEMVKYSSIIISSLPLILIYPFFQKYFEKGVMVGSIKG
ncbi:carbohydrate ABC transporter permease [Bacillus sp. FJAT-42376]|uniref:carbohydrate ABC transporter permease n=1 Tax=Bacillus sp. FJAT-42376 TaxID=2014076 RepID=UPI000F4EFF4A|nr:carbohydrate ABC transporter permease [Bacillus sp. FJAT-42376]AZB44527.1 carbohydrate ABC transporter permease [Bacillus sp. FJAT-42376]